MVFNIKTGVGGFKLFLEGHVQLVVDVKGNCFPEMNIYPKDLYVDTGRNCVTYPKDL